MARITLRVPPPTPVVSLRRSSYSYGIYPKPTIQIQAPKNLPVQKNAGAIRRLAQIQDAYTYMRGFIERSYNKWAGFALLAKINESGQLLGIPLLVGQVKCFIDREHRRMAVGMNYRWGEWRQIQSDEKETPEFQARSVSNAIAAYQRNREAIVADIQQRFPGLGVQDVTDEYPEFYSRNVGETRHRVTFAHGFVLVIGVPLGKIHLG